MEIVNTPLLDFAWANKNLAWQKHATYAAGALMVALNQNVALALLCCGICLLAEHYEARLCREVLKTKKTDKSRDEELTARLLLSGILVAGSIVFFVSCASVAEGPSVHTGPLLFLGMASLYTAINTCQLRRVMIARLLVFTVGFLFVPLYDLIVVWPQHREELWSQLGFSIFGFLFVAECARKFASHPQAVQTKMAKLRIERDRLAEAFELQSQFVSTASHELRTPLTSVKAALDLISSEKGCKTLSDARRIGKMGQRNGVRLAALIDDLLDFQKLEVTGMGIQLRRIDLRDLVQDAVQGNCMLGKSREIVIEVSLPEKPLYVMGDHNRLLQVMANVLSNAVKFSPDGGTVEVSTEQDGTKVRILVCDHGIGIPDDARDLVFAPFAQVDGSDKRKYGGTGLGMSISERIMKGHGGTIDYSSKLGEGTVFAIELDLDATSTVEEVEADKPCAPGWESATLIDDLKEVPQLAS